MSKSKPLPSVQYLNECFKYDRSTGVLTWLNRPESHFRNKLIAGSWNKKMSGETAGTLAKDQSLHVSVCGRILRCHRIIFKIIHGTETAQVDHINGNPADNRISNLRAASNRQNSRNSKTYLTNKSGYKGVAPYYNKKGELIRYTAQITHNYKKIHLGMFDTPELAHKAYIKASQELFGEFACNGRRGHIND